MRWLIGLVALGVALSGCSTSDSFTVGEDDLCEWLTEEQVAAAAAAGYATLGVDWDGEVELVQEGGIVPAPGEEMTQVCSWAVKATGSHAIQVHFASADAVIPDWDDVEVVPHQDYDPDRGSVQAFDHPALDREIVGFGAGGWGELGFGTLGTDDVLVVNALLGEDVRSEHDEATIAVAASLMDDLGWPPEA